MHHTDNKFENYNHLSCTLEILQVDYMCEIQVCQIMILATQIDALTVKIWFQNYKFPYKNSYRGLMRPTSRFLLKIKFGHWPWKCNLDCLILLLSWFWSYSFVILISKGSRSLLCILEKNEIKLYHWAYYFRSKYLSQ